MNPDAPFSTNGIHKPTLKPERKNVPALVIALIAVPLLFLVVFPVAWTIAKSTGTPVFVTPAEINVAEIDHFEVRLFNLKASFNPDRKVDDVGPYVAKSGRLFPIASTSHRRRNRGCPSDQTVPGRIPHPYEGRSETGHSSFVPNRTRRDETPRI